MKKKNYEAEEEKEGTESHGKAWKKNLISSNVSHAR